MRILFVCALSIGVTAISGCLNSDMSDPVTDTMAKTRLLYKTDIQQGNVISQEQVNKLEPGMSKRQVRYLMGTPMLVDTFHQDRWDYVFTMKKGGGKLVKKRDALYFVDDQLSRIEGDYRPQPNNEPPAKEIVVTVPDYKGKKRGFVDSTLKAVGLRDKTPKVVKSDKDEVAEKVEEVAEAVETTALPEPERAVDEAAETAKEEVNKEIEKAAE